MDEGLPRCDVLQTVAQVAHVTVDRAVGHVAQVGVHQVEQPLARGDPLGLRRRCLQQAAPRDGQCLSADL
jgi:hypothetical protein